MIRAALALLNHLAAWLDEYRRRRAARAAQHERDALEHDPLAWYDGHFDSNGLRDTEAADATDKTDAARPRQSGE